MRLEKFYPRRPDIKLTQKVFQMPFEELSTYFRSEDTKGYLFPHQRVMVDIVPYKLFGSSIALMKEMSGDHTKAFSDVRIEKGVTRGLLSFGTLFRAQKVEYVYGIEFYGTDAKSIRRHIMRHLFELHQNAYGSICLMLFVQEYFPQKVADDICTENGMKRVNCLGTSYPQWNFQKRDCFRRGFVFV